jgi:hypothetical protein
MSPVTFSFSDRRKSFHPFIGIKLFSPELGEEIDCVRLYKGN